MTEYTLKISLELAYGNVSITCESDDEDAPYIGGCGRSLEEALPGGDRGSFGLGNQGANGQSRG